jgi:hypothetical protein
LEVLDLDRPEHEKRLLCSLLQTWFLAGLALDLTRKGNRRRKEKKKTKKGGKKRRRKPLKRKAFSIATILSGQKWGTTKAFP